MTPATPAPEAPTTGSAQGSAKGPARGPDGKRWPVWRVWPRSLAGRTALVLLLANHIGDDGVVLDAIQVAQSAEAGS